VRILQRCPHFRNDLFEPLQRDPSKLLLMTHPDGIEVDDSIRRVLTNQREHDPSDLVAAQAIAQEPDTVAVGLFYRRDTADRYDLYSAEGLGTSRSDKITALRAELDRYQI
jgi:hypothetical protein